MNGLQHTGAFVVQFGTNTTVSAGRVEGRIEHVASGETARFESAGQLFAFVDRMLTRARDEARPFNSTL
jgi:hypothetical protein